MVAVRDGADQAEPEPVARRAAAGLEPDKAVEHGLAIGFGNARTTIGHFEHGALAGSKHPDLQLAAIGIFHCVVEEIGDRLRQQMPVAADLTSGSIANCQRKPLFLSHRLVKFGRRARDFAEIEHLGSILPSARLRLGNPQQRVEGR